MVALDTPLNENAIGYNMYNKSENNDTSKKRDNLLMEINKFAQLSALIGLVMLVFTYLAVIFFNLATHSQINRLRRRFFRSVLYQDISFFDVHRTDDLASRMNE